MQRAQRLVRRVVPPRARPRLSECTPREKGASDDMGSDGLEAAPLLFLSNALARLLATPSALVDNGRVRSVCDQRHHGNGSIANRSGVPQVGTAAQD